MAKESMAKPLTQSVGIMHIFPDEHFGHTPPQSTSVSFWFRIPSVHEGAALHTLLVQMLLWQSPAPMHFLPFRHFGHTPPQSTSVSFWFWIPSVHEGAGTHRLLVHTPLA